MYEEEQYESNLRLAQSLPGEQVEYEDIRDLIDQDEVLELSAKDEFYFREVLRVLHEEEELPACRNERSKEETMDNLPSS